MKDWKDKLNKLKEKWEQAKKSMQEAVNSKKGRVVVSIICYVLLALVCASMLWTRQMNQGADNDIQKLDYTEFIKLVEDGSVDTIYYSSSE